MDVEVLGRERADERAIIEELSGPPRPVRAADRRWMLAIAGIAAIVCMGFAGDLISPAPADPMRLPDQRVVASSAPSVAPIGPARGIDVDLSSPEDAVIDGLVPVRVRTVPNHRVHLSVSVGTAVVGWQQVKVDEHGEWVGTVQVFAPRVALPATLHAATSIGSLPVEGLHDFVLGGAPPIVVWEASVTEGRTGDLTVFYRASAPLAITRVDAWVSGPKGVLAGASGGASRVEEWLPGSAGAAELGLGSVAGAVSIPRGTKGQIALHLRWHDASTGTSGVIERVLVPTIRRPPPGRPSRLPWL